MLLLDCHFLKGDKLQLLLIGFSLSFSSNLQEEVVKLKLTAALETSAKMVQLVSPNNMAIRVNACLGMVDSCVRSTLMNVL